MSEPADTRSRVRAYGALATRAVEKIWGRTSLPEPFSTQQRELIDAGKPVGEIWFASPPELDDILVKYLFTSDKLSVQVHPSDAQAQAGEAGKEECWLILDAEPGAKLAIGFKHKVSADTMRAAALDGSIEELLEWHSVSAGDFFYLPAGTVHAIGAGISLVEVQQSSDTTFRLYDYGRPRELHLDRGIEVAHGDTYGTSHRAKVRHASEHLVTGPHFRLTRLVGQPDASLIQTFADDLLVLPLSGEVTHAGAVMPSGSCVQGAALESFSFSDDAVALLVSR